MGGTTSKAAVVQEIDTLAVSKNDLTIINKKLNDVQVDTIIKDAQTCSAGITQDQLQKYKGIKSMGKLRFDIKQKQASSLTFSCLNISKVRNDIVSNMTSSVMQNLESTTDNEILNKMGAIAASKAEQGSTFPFPFPTSPGSESHTNIKQIQRTKNVTENKKNIQNIVEHAIKSTLTVENIKTCINTVSNVQSVTFEDIVGEEIDFVIDQNQAADLIAECINQSDVTQQVTGGLLDFFEIKTKDVVKTTVQTQMEADAESLAKKKGLLEELGGIFGGGFGGFGLGGMGPSMSSSSSCICCILCIVIIIFVVLPMFSDTGAGGEVGMEPGYVEQPSATSPGEYQTQYGGYYNRLSATSSYYR